MARMTLAGYRFAPSYHVLTQVTRPLSNRRFGVLPALQTPPPRTFWCWQALRYRLTNDTYTTCEFAPAIVKGSVFDTVAAPTFSTLMLAAPANAISAAGISTVSCVALTKWVVRATPFHCTIASAAKLAPVMVSVNATPPAGALVLLRAVSVGAAMAICFQDCSSAVSAWGVLVGTPWPLWSVWLMPWHEAQTRISPGCIVSQKRSRTTGAPMLSVNCQVIARRAGTKAAIEPSFPSATLLAGPEGLAGWYCMAVGSCSGSASTRRPGTAGKLAVPLPFIPRSWSAWSSWSALIW